LPPVAETDVGAPGAPKGVTGDDGDDDGDPPETFRATTVKVYDVPFVSPGTTQLVAPVVEHEEPIGELLTV